MSPADNIKSQNANLSLLPGFALALGVGLCLGVFRYWFGFFVLINGVIAGLATGWLVARTCGRPEHPGFGKALSLALAWSFCLIAGQLIGLGLAQPWFEPLDWLGRIWSGDSKEFAFGLAANLAVARSFSLGASGGFWLILNIIDITFMCFFLIIMPWNTGGKGAEKEGKHA